jgi:hypothetical protein
MMLFPRAEQLSQFVCAVENSPDFFLREVVSVKKVLSTPDTDIGSQTSSFLRKTETRIKQYRNRSRFAIGGDRQVFFRVERFADPFYELLCWHYQGKGASLE